MQRAMKKELIICLVIICSIVIGDIWLQNYTSKTMIYALITANNNLFFNFFNFTNLLYNIFINYTTIFYFKNLI